MNTSTKNRSARNTYYEKKKSIDDIVIIKKAQNKKLNSVMRITRKQNKI